MVDSEIVNYIKEYREKDFTDKEIRESLQDQDIEKEVIDAAFSSLKKKPTPESLDPVDVKFKAVFLGAFTISLVLGLYLLKNAGLSSGFLLTPVSTVLSIVRGELNLNYATLVVACAILASGFFTIGHYAIKRSREDLIIYATVPLACVSLIGLFGWSTLSLFAGLGASISMYLFITKVEDKKVHYKQIDVQEIIVMSFRHALIFSSLILAIGIFVTLRGSPDFAELEINSFLSTAGLDMAESGDIKEQIIAQQMDAQTQMLQGISTALAASVQGDPDIPDSCKLRVAEKIDVINEKAQETLEENFEEINIDEELPPETGDTLDKMQNLISSLKDQYPFLAALSAFMLIELLRKGVAFFLMIECIIAKYIQEKV